MSAQGGGFWGGHKWGTLGGRRGAVEWLNSSGIRHVPTRIGKYERALATPLDAFRSSDFETMRQQLVSIVAALFEVSDLIDIHRHLSGKFDHELVEHVKASVSGAHKLRR